MRHTFGVLKQGGPAFRVSKHIKQWVADDKDARFASYIGYKPLTASAERLRADRRTNVSLNATRVSP
jgi:hypothetical protein